ncbi:hypothetical protein [Aquimarina aggregata]|uniref:hypothetical protein n=1 Tax=Aquimarina aggregata TaxID=1642818 RepID=UPI00249100A9|nr:hypothetical protein [Aquimarina aggregata]
MNNKKIYRYTNVELFDLIKNGNNKIDTKNAELELKSRNLTQKQLSEVEIEYFKYKKNQNDRKTAPLTPSEWIPLFFLPFFIPTQKWRSYDHFSKSEFERYEKYGFDEKAREARKIRLYGILFWILIIINAVFIYNYLTR